MRKKFVVPLLAIGALLFALSPSVALARNEGGAQRGGGHGGGHSFSGGGLSRGGGFAGGRNHFSGRDFGERGERFERGSGDRDHDRYFRRGGLYFGAPYVYGPNYYYPGACNPTGYYDQRGNWVPYPGCYVDPYHPY
jgi:hypothetical protein